MDGADLVVSWVFITRFFIMVNDWYRFRFPDLYDRCVTDGTSQSCGYDRRCITALDRAIWSFAETGKGAIRLLGDCRMRNPRSRLVFDDAIKRPAP